MDISKVKTATGWRLLTIDHKKKTKHYSKVMTYHQAITAVRAAKENILLRKL